jgi:pyruvate/2-oxoglutarate dehydrogenase complex dihydrolipoamide acyltransferase (E2) component
MAEETTITMPPLGESVSEGTIIKWLKKVGEHVDQDEPLVEVLTDKINAEVPSQVAGTVTKLLANEGDIVKVGAPMCVISANGAQPAATVTPARDEAAQPPKQDVTTASQAEAAAAAAQTEPPDQSPAAVKEDTGLYPSDPSKVITLPSSRGQSPAHSNGDDTARRLRERSSPLVRRILAENNVDLSVIDQIHGTGSEGRVTKEDVLAFLDQQKGQAAPATAVQTPAAAVAAPAPTAPQTPATPASSTSPVPPPADTDAEIIPLAGIRKMIAERLSYSEHVAPHVTTFAEVDVTDLVALRARYKQWAQEEEGVNLTYMPFVIKAVCAGLRAFPGINSSLIDGNLYQHKRIHIALAVSLDQAGLILPVIKDADRLGIIELARRVADLATRARSNKLTPDEVRGSTFTISNPGAFGGWISTPIINQPNAAILNTGKIMKMPWVMPDDTIAPRSIMYLSLSYDHRIVDGETSVKFLQSVKKNLEQVDKFLLL